MSKSGECEKKCYNWAKLRFQGKPQELICGSKTRRPQLKWTPKEMVLYQHQDDLDQLRPAANIQ